MTDAKESYRLHQDVEAAKADPGLSAMNAALDHAVAREIARRGGLGAPVLRELKVTPETAKLYESYLRNDIAVDVDEKAREAFAPSPFKVNEDGETVCRKCGATSGDNWRQCEDGCPVPFSPHYDPKV